MAAVYPLKLDQGETFRLALVYALPGETPEDLPVAVDISGATVKMQVREKYGSPVLAEATTENGGVVIDGPAGRIELVLTDVQTDVMGVKVGSSRPRTSALYDLELVLPSGDVKRVIEGTIQINPNITRDDGSTATPETATDDDPQEGAN